MFEVKKSPFHPLETKFPQTHYWEGTVLCCPLKMKLLNETLWLEMMAMKIKGFTLVMLRSSLADSLTDSRPSTPRFCLFQMAH